MKKPLIITALRAGLALLCLTGSAQNLLNYDPGLGTLPPAQGFTLVDDGIAPSATVAGGFLNQNTAGNFAAHQSWYAISSNAFDFAAGFTLEANLRVISSSYNPNIGSGRPRSGYALEAVDNAGRFLGIEITSTGLWLDVSSDSEPWGITAFKPFVATNGFNVYRLVAQGGTATLYINGSAFLSTNLGPVVDLADANMANFGESTAYAGSQTELASFRVVGGVAPSISVQPQSQTNVVGATASFTVTATGTPSLGYQWQLNGTNLTENTRISGSLSNSLTISNLMAGDAGNYQVIVTNANGLTVSSNALLTVTTNSILPAASLALAWGRGDYGELGDGVFHTNSPYGSSTPVTVNALPGGRRMLSVAGSDEHSLALADDGTLWAWGYGIMGQLGDGTLTYYSSTPVAVTALAGGRKAVAAATGASHCLALANDGSLWAWGFGGSGQLGNGAQTNSSTPVAVTALPGGRKAVAIAAGGYHNLALAGDGTVWAWGYGPNGELGNGTFTNSSIPVAVISLPGGRKAVAIAAGLLYSLALADDSTLWAWGYGNYGQLGDGMFTNSSTPLAVTALPGGRKPVTVTSSGYHSLALADDGTLWAWGFGLEGELGNGTFTNSSIPVAVTALPGGRKPVTVAAGGNHNLALANDGTLWAWGYNNFGQLGNGMFTNSSTPVAVIGLPTDRRVLSMGAGDVHSFALLGGTNQPPVARCKNVTVTVVAGCSAAASIDDGSYDPDAGNSITLAQTPAGPYPVGQTTVTLTVTDSLGATNSCITVVTVNDTQPPVITCPANLVLAADAGRCSRSNVTFTVSATDNCSVTNLVSSPPSGSTFPVGMTTVTNTATDASGNTSSCTFTVTVNDIPPVVATQPQSHTNYIGTVATFTVAASSCSLLSYQWLLNGTPLTNNAHIGGATSSALSISNVQLIDSGDYQVVITNLYASATSSVAVLAVGTAEVWSGAVSGNWDTNTLNWQILGNPTAYGQGNRVVFDDTLSGTSSVILTTALAPGGILATNSLVNYLFTGAGSLSGTGALVKAGSGTLRLSETGGDGLSGGLTVNGGVLVLDNPNSAMSGGLVIGGAGTVQVGNSDTQGALPAGGVTLNGKLVFARSNNLTVTNVIAGSRGGLLVKSNGNVLTVSGSNIGFTGAVTVARGTLRIGKANALGSGTNAPITVASGATLDVNGIVGTNAVVVAGTGVSGNGAIVNNASTQGFPALAFMTLTGDTTIGGLNRWDLRPADGSPAADTVGPGFAGLSTGGNPYNLTKIGNNVIGLVSATVDPKLADVRVQGGTLLLEGDLTGLGDPTNTLTVASNTTLQFYNLTNQLRKVMVLSDGAVVLNSSGTNIILGPVTLNTNSSGGPGNCTFNVGGSYLWASAGNIGGPGNLIKLGASPFYVSGVNNYTGNTEVRVGTLSLWGSGSISNSQTITVSAGATLDAASRNDMTLGLSSGSTLRGDGAVTGDLFAGPGSTLMPGTNSQFVGVLTVVGNANLGGTTVMKLNAAGTTNDQLRAYHVVYGGTLTLTNLGGALAAGNAFNLFNAGGYSGAFSTIVPAAPGPGLVWDINTLGQSGLLGVLPTNGLVIYQQPSSVNNVYVGGTRTFTVLAGSVAQLAYQWLFNGTNAIPGATNASWTLSNAQFGNAGIYSCMVSNSLGSLASSNASLAVMAVTLPPVVLADHPLGCWRLNEGNGSPAKAAFAGEVASDYVGGYDGIYTTNVQIGVQGLQAFDPDTAASFGTLATSGSYVGSIAGIDFSQQGSNSQFSVEAWVLANRQNTDNGIVTIGYGGGGEQFDLDTTISTYCWRFLVRDAQGTAHLAVSTNAPDGNWHHLVGVCDQPHGAVYLYLDGALTATSSVPVGAAVLPANTPMTIGAREVGAPSTKPDLQFIGTIDEVALYAYPLTAAQVLNHYSAASQQQSAPIIVLQPQSQTVVAGTDVTLSVTATGMPPPNYQWWRNGVRIAGATNATWILTNAQPTHSGTYWAVVSNSVASVTSARARIMVNYPSTAVSPIVLTGWNRDVVAENASVPTAEFFDTASFGDVWREAGLGGEDAGLPPGRLFTSSANTNVNFELQPYTTNNVLWLSPTSGLTSATLELAVPRAYTKLAIAAASTFAASAGNQTYFYGSLLLHFTDGTDSAPIRYLALDWFDYFPQRNAPLMPLAGLDYFSLVGPPLWKFGAGYGVGFYETDIDLAASALATKPLASITFTAITNYPTIGNPETTGIFAVSGQPTPLPTFTGIAQLGGGNLTLGGLGIGGQAYVLLAASNCVPPVVWAPIATNTADGNGLVSFSDLMSANNPQRFYQIRPLLQPVISDPVGNLTGDTNRTYMDIVTVTLRTEGTNYVADVQMAGTFPSAADMAGGKRFDVIWFVDIDRNRATGQSADGNDYNIQIYLDGTGWHPQWFKVDSVSQADGITIVNSAFTITVVGDRVSLTFPQSYLPRRAFDMWATCFSGNAPAWTPNYHESKHRACHFQFLAPCGEKKPT